jgi:hypothetical protein
MPQQGTGRTLRTHSTGDVLLPPKKGFSLLRRPSLILEHNFWILPVKRKGSCCVTWISWGIVSITGLALTLVNLNGWKKCMPGKTMNEQNIS